MSITWLNVKLVKDHFEANTTEPSTGQRVWEIEADSSITESDAYGASTGGGSPTIYDTIPFGGAAWSGDRPLCVLAKRTFDRRTAKKGTITGDYQEPSFGPGDAKTVAELEALDAEIEYRSQEFMEEYTVDRSSTPKKVVNSAGFPWGQNPHAWRESMFFESGSMSAAAPRLRSTTRNAP